MTAPDLLSDLPVPTPDAVLAARTAAGHSQGMAASTAGLASAMRWSEYERSVRQIDLARWALYLLATDQHPAYRLASRPNRAVARRSGAG